MLLLPLVGLKTPLWYSRPFVHLQTISWEQPKVDWGISHLILLYLLDQTFRVILDIQVHVSTRSPFPRADKERPSINAGIRQDPQRAFTSIFSRRELDA